MGGEGEPVPGRVGLHEGEVVLEPLRGEGQHGGREAVGEQVAALGGQLADSEDVGVRREALEAVVDPFPGESGERVECLGTHGTSPSGALQMLQRPLRISLTAV